MSSTKSNFAIKTIEFCIKTVDSLFIECLNKKGETVGLYNDYVPQFFPSRHGSPHWGDYIMFDVDFHSGKITNWERPTDGQLKRFQKSKSYTGHPFNNGKVAVLNLIIDCKRGFTGFIVGENGEEMIFDETGKLPKSFILADNRSLYFDVCIDTGRILNWSDYLGKDNGALMKKDLLEVSKIDAPF